MSLKNYFASMAVVFVTISACSSPEVKDNQLSADEKKEGYELLFDGTTTNGWHIYNQGKVVSAWSAENGELKCNPESNGVRGDLVTDSKYENFELKFDWKISKEGNSGVFINVNEKPGNPTAWASGPEYQLLEESHHDYEKEMKRAGCLYNFSAQLNPAPLKALGQWNQSSIKQKDGKVEFYLNGILTAKQDFKSAQWMEMVASSNFKPFPEFGKQVSGEIALQDWNKGIAFKNIKIRKI